MMWIDVSAETEARLGRASARAELSREELIRAAIERELQRHEEIGVAVDCTTCRRTKAPRGRSVPTAAANGMCDRECPGYYLEPRVGDLWPGESRAEFGYP